MDCNFNGIYDDCDVACGTSGTRCDVPGCGTSSDCDGNNIPDECDWDCNGNSIPDACDITSGSSQDTDGDGKPDECQIGACCQDDLTCQSAVALPSCSGASEVFAGNDTTCGGGCRSNGFPDTCAIELGISQDCNGNGFPDECDLISGTSLDCNNNSVPDECDTPDCDGNDIPDECEELGPCCTPPGECFMTHKSCCQALGYGWYGFFANDCSTGCLSQFGPQPGP